MRVVYGSGVAWYAKGPVPGLVALRERPLGARFTGVEYVVTLPLYLDLAAVFLGGLSGSLHAVRRGFSLTGLIALAIAAGLGGGILRDVLLQALPVAFKEPWYLPTVLVAAGIGFFFGSVVGAQKALDYGLSGFSAILLGVVTAVGGSVLVDLLAGERPELVQPGPIGHFGAVIGAVVYVVMVRWLAVDSLIAMVVTVVLVFAIRMSALRFGIQVPTAIDIPETIKRVRARARRPGASRLRGIGRKIRKKR
jgi:uncharacterized membrane protein YeiH